MNKLEFVKEDFKYYERTIERVYSSYYKKRLTVATMVLIITAGYALMDKERVFLNIVVIGLVLAYILFLLNQKNKFDEIYAFSLRAIELEKKVDRLIEDEYCYNVVENDGEVLSISKSGVRNLPSCNKQLTLLVGFEKKIFCKKSFHLIYYDMLDITYEEKFRLKQNGHIFRRFF